MKKYGVMLFALLACGAVNATQDATLTQREVRDPRQLEVILEANATDAETRLADIEAGTAIDDITVNNATVNTNITVGDKAGQAGTVAVRDGTIDTFAINAAGMVDIGAWGYTGEHVGLIDDGSGNTVPGFGQYNEVKTEIAGGKVLAAKYTRLLVSSNQVNDVSFLGHESQFRLRNANLANGVHAGLWAYAEQSGTSVLSDNGTFDAIHAAVESEVGFEVGATEQVTGITLDSSINSGATIAGAANFSAVYIKSNGLDWFNGLYITGCDNDILLDGGATINQSAADTLTLTEDNVAVDGALTATSYEGVAAATMTAGVAAGNTAVQPADVWGPPGLTVTTNSVTEIVVEVQTKTIDDADLAERRVVRAFIAETSGGIASTNNISAFTLSGGTALDTIAAEADYRYVTSALGTNTITITGVAADQHFVTVVDGSSTTEVQIDFVGP